jgi:hypothetical protein
MFNMSPENQLLEYIRQADWVSALTLVKSQDFSTQIQTPESSVFVWLIKLNAPTELIIALLKFAAEHESIDVNELGLLEVSMDESSTKTNAFEIFSSLLKMGLTPNVVVAGRGCTLLQMAMELNKVREVKELLRYGVDLQQMSVFGRESTTNLEEAKLIGNAAALLVLESAGIV